MNIMDHLRTTEIPSLAEQYQNLSDLVLEHELNRFDTMMQQLMKANISSPEQTHGSVQQVAQPSNNSCDGIDDAWLLGDYLNSDMMS